ncbi:hypothetical protein [Gemmatimonas sp.]|uniref:hypothetical protein n=1 Tax=Gemmatimonas sp. TaxID=1962908 RepID=UPI0025C044EC|nr:hypothetical protein [Gemmatimonas sp.]MCA2992053.1 hypothetical protein [Gemmatimonas sp.]
MGFARQAALSARGTGPYGQRALLIENHGRYAAVGLTVTFSGKQGPVELLTAELPARLEAGGRVELPLRRVRRDAVFTVALSWGTEGGESGEFFGVVTAGLT